MAQPEGTALEAELFGQDEVREPSVPAAVREKEEMDVDEAPHQAMSGQVPVPPEPALNPNDFKDENESEGDDDDLFGDGAGSDEDERDPDLKAIDQHQVTRDQNDDDDDGFIVPDDDDDGLTAEEREMRRRLEYAEEDGADGGSTVRQEQIAQIALSNYGMPPQGKVWHARLPNFLAVESNAFDELLWDPPEQDDQPVTNGESQESMNGGGTPAGGSGTATPRNTLPDENLIRWRWVKDRDGRVVRQSNARVVRWSDGSLSLQVGPEMFDIAASVDQSALLASTTAAAQLGPSKSSLANTTAELSAFDENRGHGLTYMTIKHDEHEIMEAQASVHGTMTFRPATLTSTFHRRLAEGVAGRYVKGRGTKVAALPEADPERLKAEREREALDKQRKARREADKSNAARRRKRRARGETKLEGVDMDEDEYESDAYGGAVGYSDDDEATGKFRSRRQQPTRRKSAARGGQGDEDEDDVRDFVVSDGEGEEEEADMDQGNSDDDLDGAPDELERAEAAIEQSDRGSRKKSSGKPAAAYSSDEAGGEEATDAAAGAAPRRRLVVDSDEE